MCFQAWIGKSAEELHAIVGCLRQRNPGSKLVFLDPFAPADLRYAAPLGPLIDLYVKKHVLRERSRYGEPTSGDTNLTDWYGKRFGLDQPTVRFDIPEGFFSKLVVGPSFVTAPNMLPDFARGRFPDPARPRHIDLHTRIGGGGGDSWYGRMRTESLAAVSALDDVRTSGTGPVGMRAYLRELDCAKACFSPFGYGEVSWRDYEAIHAGAMLLKPDTSHIETSPDVFIANQTYVPLAWDYSDLQPKLAHYLKNPDERIALAQAAFATLHRYAAGNVFLQQMERVLSAQR